MIYLYPANKMENLLLLLNKISQLSPLGVFNQETIVVQNAGMQHWLNLAIAKDRGISMNVRYALPAQFLWKLLRALASDDKVPDQSPYSREVLCWRIHSVLASDAVITDDDFSQATTYWRGKTAEEEIENINSYSAKQAELKRYQLAVQLADLYEQYLIFRPQWLDSWQQGNFNLAGLETSQESEHKWQGKLWKILIDELPYNPVELLNDAIANIEKNKDLIPGRISFFGLNTMAPMWLDFINAISEHVEVHFFHLNPCFSYWGDIISEKQALKKISQWSEGVDDIQHFVGNPLLASLGQQGREFISLLQDYSTIDIDIFERANEEEISDNEVDFTEQSTSKLIPSVLHQLQDDILTLSDASQTLDERKVSLNLCLDNSHSSANNTNASSEALKDDSIVFASCHSALREVQALHDYLLHQFNQDNSLTPKDILVMCPQIEEYAPYVNAVFTRGWQDIDGDVPPLPCSIADRSAKDSDPLVAAFTELLALPDSRFGVTQLLAFLRLPAMADQFSIKNEDISKISAWLEDASIHWGVDLAHKQSILGEQANNTFTWQQGLSRLLRGFAFADENTVYQQSYSQTSDLEANENTAQLLLSNVEGSDAVLLGQLILFLEQLQSFSQNLQRNRTAEQWQLFLTEQIHLLFSRMDDNNVSYENSLMIIENAIAGLVEHSKQAKYEGEISLLIVVDYLTQHFSQGDASKQFMVGQVTFCSMLPMRSIPFKIIAVLGLNDGEFPRQRQPLAFDLVSLSKPILGDRSRRGDDRYLFLEAIISARNSLYLSYQGRNIKNNNEKQPSLVVKELMEYLDKGYGWQFVDGKAIHQVPMQAFSEKNYQGKWASFDANWLALGQSTTGKDNYQAAGNKTTLSGESDGEGTVLQSVEEQSVELDGIQTENEIIDDNSLSLSDQQIIRFYQHPSKMFAQQQLNLYFDNANLQLDDIEPFSVDYLETYLLRQDLLNTSVNNLSSSHLPFNNGTNALTVDDVLSRANLSGKFPDLPTMNSLFDDYQSDAMQFADEIIKNQCDNPQSIPCHLTLSLDLALNQDSNHSRTVSVSLTNQLPVKNNLLVHYRSSTAKAKDKFTLYLQQLILQVWQQQYIVQIEEGISKATDKPCSAIGVETDVNIEILTNVTSSIGLYFNTKTQKVEQYTVSSIPDAKSKLIKILKTYVKGQQQPLLLNGDIAEKVFTKSRGKSVEMTQTRFEHLWLGDMNDRGLADDDYLSYFWPECPDYSVYAAEIESIYQDLHECVVKKTTAKATKSKTTNVTEAAKTSQEVK